MKIIINSDDFGLDALTNKAIVDSFSQGLISSTTMLVNKEGFEDAITLIEKNSFLKDKVGLHFNLTDGKPLTDDIKQCSRFCNSNGYFVFDRSKPVWKLSTIEKQAISKEITAQLDRCKKYNVVLTHIDSHHHVHNEWPIGNLLAGIARKRGIKRMRLSRNIGANLGTAKKYYKQLFNANLKIARRMHTADYFGDVVDFNASASSLASSAITEIMVHAMYNKNGEIVDYDQRSLADGVRPIIALNTLIGYKDI